MYRVITEINGLVLFRHLIWTLLFYNCISFTGCINTSSLIEAALLLTGCQTYLESQENACICQRKHGEL